MTERLKPQLPQLLERYGDNMRARAKVRKIISELDTKLAELIENGKDSPEEVSRMGRVRHCLGKRAYPILLAREQGLEDSILDRLPDSEQCESLKIKVLVEKRYLPEGIYSRTLVNLANRHITDVKINSEKIVNENQKIPRAFSILDIGKALDYKVYEKAGVVQHASLIRKTARELGIAEASNPKPLFSPEEATRIMERLKQTGAIQKRETKDKEGPPKVYIKKESPKIKDASKHTGGKNHAVSDVEEIPFPKNASIRKKILEALKETSKEKPISRPKLIRMIYGNEISLTASEDKINNNLFNLRKTLEKYSWTIIKIIVGGKAEGDNRSENEIWYYLAKKDDPAEAEGIREVAADRIHIKVKEDVFVESPGLTHQRVTVDASAEKIDETQGTTVPTVSETPNAEIEPNFNPLNENEIFALTTIISHIDWHEELKKEFGINMQSIKDSGEIVEIGRLVSRINNGLKHKKTNMPDFWKENLLSARSKLKAFAKDPKIYFASCGIQAQILLKCFKLEKINDDFLKRLMEVKPSLPPPAKKDFARKN